MNLDKPLLYKVHIIDFTTSDIKDNIHYISLSIKTFTQIKYHQNIVLKINNENINITKGKPFNLFGFNNKVLSIQTWNKCNLSVIEDLILTICLHDNESEFYKINFYILN
jgi:hypothetical protein